MARYNKGLVYTNDKCISCNKCISECPVMGANVTVTHGNHTVIEVNEHNCISCGHCMSVCSHEAREYHDDTEAFLSDLRGGKKIAVAVSPSVPFPQKRTEKIIEKLNETQDISC